MLYRAKGVAISFFMGLLRPPHQVRGPRNDKLLNVFVFVIEDRITDIQECVDFRSDDSITTSFFTLHIPSFLGHFTFHRNVQYSAPTAVLFNR